MYNYTLCTQELLEHAKLWEEIMLERWLSGLNFEVSWKISCEWINRRQFDSKVCDPFYLVVHVFWKYSYFPRICITKHELVFLTQEVKWWNIAKRQKKCVVRFMWQTSRDSWLHMCNSFIRWLVESAWSVYWLSAINHLRGLKEHNSLHRDMG